LNGRNGDTVRVKPVHTTIVAVDEAVLDLLLGSRDQGVGEALSQVHGHQGHDLHRLARACRLFDKDIAVSAANIGDQALLVGPQGLAGCRHDGVPKHLTTSSSMYPK
jgi:hypothetical protein